MTEQPSPESIFEQVLQCTGTDERTICLEEACGGNETLRREVESLLAAHQAAGSFLDPVITPEPTTPGEQEGDQIGHYKLLDLIGEGGFGRVWMAEQTEPVQRRVALKIVKLGMDTGEVLARFEAERQALALMEHPNIAQVFDGGATDTGRPYFVMELVRGVPITDYCDANKLPPRARIELFEKVCRAVQHAHQKGIIHRDLKPSNILVTVQDDQPVPKVIDFGIAKALQTRLTERTLFTRFNQWVGTPAYMSPEQAGLGSLDVDVRSDVYSLGTILYELLTGNTPFDQAMLRENGYEAMLRTIREEDPPKPSTRLSSLPREALHTVADHRGASPEKLGRELRGELDWILLMALERDRSRRYESATALAAELARFSRGEPVSAAPPSIAYRSRKLLRRHWKWTSVAAAFVVVLVTGTAVSTRQAFVADRERNDAEEAREDAELARQRADDESARRQVQLREAQRQRDRAEWLHYAEQIQLAQRKWDAGDVKQARSLLDAAPWHLRAWEYRYLHTLFESNQRTLRGHGDPVNDTTFSPYGHRQVKDIAFSPDGTLLASCSSDGEVRVWDVKSGETKHTIKGHRSVWSLAVSPDGNLLATAGFSDKTVKLWDIHTGKDILTYSGHDDCSRCVAFSPDGLKVASAGDDSGEVRLWDSRSGSEILVLKGHTNGVSEVAFSPDGRHLASGSWDQPVRLWDVKTGTEVLSIGDLPGGVGSVAFSPDGARIASALGKPEKTGEVLVWDARTGRKIFALEGHSDRALDLCFSPDGEQIASVSGDGMLKIWDAQNGEEVRSLRGHSGAVTCVAFNPDGMTIATGGEDRTVKLWDSTINQGSLVRKLPRGTTVTFTPDNRCVAIGGSKGNLVAREIDLREQLIPPPEGDDPIDVAACSLDGKLVAGSYRRQSGNRDTKTSGIPAPQRPDLIIWATRTGQEVVNLGRQEVGQPAMAFSPDGRTLAVVGQSEKDKNPQRIMGRITLWDVKTGSRVHTLGGAGGEVTALSYSPDGSLLAGAFGDASFLPGTVQIWDARTGKAACQPRNHPGMVMSVAFNPDGTHLATGTSDGLVRVCEVETGRQVFALRGHTGRVSSVTFSPDGTRLATGSGDRTVRIWSAATGFEALALRGHNEDVTDLAFSPDGRRLVSTSWVGTIRVWDATSEPESRRLQGHSGCVTELSFSHDAGRLASAGEDFTVRIWDLGTGSEDLTITDPSGPVVSTCLSPDGRLLASGSGGLGAYGGCTTLWGSAVTVWDAKTGRKVGEPWSSSRGLVSVVRFSADGRWLAALVSEFENGNALYPPLKWESGIRVWKVNSWNEPARMLRWSSLYVMAISPDGGLICGAELDTGNGGTEVGTITIWDARNGRVVRSFRGHTSMLTGIVFSPDGRWLATGSQDGTARIWEVKTGKEILTLRGEPGGVRALRFTRDGTRLFTGSHGGGRIWDVRTGVSLRRFEADAGNRISTESFMGMPGDRLVVSPDFRWLAAGYIDGKIRVSRIRDAMERD